ncbi:sigma-70 family RNA polymerase sigma factor [Tenggerimyces flavus]|uniref:sigma-70 family RNA polymerase sigma factor n=1 Tax=Tenggerimyces flavus TaxID=1708749 RepID=UPI003FD70094|nr:RNA polymerase sigma-70 factor (ECF subfamily) [Tenggerimyces flavus]
MPDEPNRPRDREEGVGSAALSGATADEELIRELYTEHAGPLLGYVLRLVRGDRQRAEDVVQETLLRAWRHPESLDPARGSLRVWLATVARNIVVDGERARRARPYEVGEDALSVVPADGNEIDKAMLAWEVMEVLAELAPHHREVVVEVYYRGRSVAEAASVLGVPPGTVKSRTYYALRQLKLLLEERGMTPEVAL